MKNVIEMGLIDPSSFPEGYNWMSSIDPRQLRRVKHMSWVSMHSWLYKFLRKVPRCAGWQGRFAVIDEVSRYLSQVCSELHPVPVIHVNGGWNCVIESADLRRRKWVKKRKWFSRRYLRWRCALANTRILKVISLMGNAYDTAFESLLVACTAL